MKSIDNDKETLPFTMGLPAFAIRTLDVLETAGYEAWIVGGFVRDAALDRPGVDIDVATRASWREVQRVFEAAGYHTHETGTAHGTLTVIVDGCAVEVTTYRSDGVYDDARHPKSVSFVDSIDEDLARRDFTVNALAYHPVRGLRDPFGGLDDLRAKTIRAVGNATQRFSEDALRILRACRFAAQLGFSIEDNTRAGMLANKGLLGRISAERVAHELELLLLAPYAGRVIVEQADVLAAVLPELVAMEGFDQRTPYHIYDVLEHTAHVVDATPAYPLVRWAALLHDMGKPAAFFTDEQGVGHFYGHARISVQLGRGILRRLCYSTAFTDKVLELVRCHDDVLEPTPRVVKRALARLGGDTELFEALCDLKRADALGQAPQCAGRVETTEELRRTMIQIREDDEAFSLKKLAINGRDIMDLGIQQGPTIGTILEAALDAVIDERVTNTAEDLREFVRQLVKQKASSDLLSE